MAPDYDLSSLQPWQADLWIRLQVHVVLAQILAEQGKRPASTRWAGPHPGTALEPGAAVPRAARSRCLAAPNWSRRLLRSRPLSFSSAERLSRLS